MMLQCSESSHEVAIQQKKNFLKHVGTSIGLKSCLHVYKHALYIVIVCLCHNMY